MNTRTLTTAACFFSLCAAAFAGCAAEESTPGEMGPTSGGNSGNTGTPTASNTTSGTVSNTVNNTTSSSTTGGATTASSTTATSTTATTGTATTGAATTGAATSTTGGGSGCDAPPATGSAPMIDDFMDNDHTILPNEGRLGYWYSYNDMTAGATQTLQPQDGEVTTDGMLHSTATGFADWGAGFGVDLNNDNSTSMSCAYNASAHTGVQFTITTDVDLSFIVALVATNADSDHYMMTIPAGTSGQFQAPFASLMQGGWGTAATWDPTTITALQWQAAAGVDYNVTLDDVSFY